MVDACIYLSSSEQAFLAENDLFQTVPEGWFASDEDTPLFYNLLKSSRGHLDALYKVWKHNKHDYVGFVHDHYYLSFSQKEYDRDVTLPYIDRHALSYYGWNQRNISVVVQEGDVFIPQLNPLTEIYYLSPATEAIDFYEEKVGNNTHILKAVSYIKETYPDKYITTLKVVHSNQLLPWNIFFARKDIFDEYCMFIFDIISKIAQSSSEEENNKANFYIISLLLTTIFFESVEKSSPHYRVVHTPVVFVDTTLPSYNAGRIIASVLQNEKSIKKMPPKEVLYGGKINIIMSFDDNYADHARAVINSILSHTANQSDLEIYIVYGPSLSSLSIKRLQELYNGSVSLIFKEINNKYAEDFPLGIKYISQSTYYRLFVQDLLPATVKRLIYLDTDIIVCDDIVDLWNINLAGHTIAGVRDIDEVENRHNVFGRMSKSTYINAGILVYDIGRAQERYGSLSRYFMEVYYKNRKNIKFQDQDIINIAFQDDIFILPLRWNIISFLFFFSPLLMEYNIDNLSSQHSVPEIKEAMENPGIFHFIGRRKPWTKSCLNPFKELYWHYRAQDPTFKPTFLQRIYRWNHYVVIRNGFLCLFFKGKIRVIQLRSWWKSLKKRLGFSS
ncbi:glycosyltransferase [Acetobacteraceae bacterium ESL0709]|nr:glycosyltransferase [Acetobacteraceae bacterium ESL0697]MDF7678979.1 glycosyltransferase [Acetobacteraceae bacterium ESL0709]